MHRLRLLRSFLLLSWVFVAICQSASNAAEIRTWADSTGRFKIEAKLVSHKDEKVRLERADGKSMEIDFSKLSEADQKYLKELESNPFKTAEDESPFMPAKENGKPAGEPGQNSSKITQVNWDQSELIEIDSFGDGWNYETSSAGELDFVPKAVELPKRVEFFEKMQSLCVNREAKKAVIGYLWTFATKNNGPQTRLVMCDLENGKVASGTTMTAEMVPLALHPDGQQVLMKNAERNQDGLEIWTVQGRNTERGGVFLSHNSEWGRSSEVQWARFADANSLIMKHSNGWVSIWDVPRRQPIYHFQIDGGCTPALSADGKTLAFYQGERIGLFDIETQEVVAMQKAPRRLSWPNFAFSPSEKKLACVAFNSIFIWDTETGELNRDFETPGITINGVPEFSDEDFLLVGKRYLVELENMIKLWDYEGAEQVEAVGGTTFFAVSPQNVPGALMPTLIPHETAMQALDAALNEPDLFVFREGVSVQLDLAGIPASHRAEVEANIRSSLNEMNVKVVSNAPLTITGSVKGPKQEQMNYTSSGTYTVQVYRTLLEFVHEGKTVWQSSGTNIPHFVSIKSGENLGDILREKSKQPAYGFYKNVVLPKFVQKPLGDSQAGQTGGQTLGVSKVVPSTPKRSPRRRR